MQLKGQDIEIVHSFYTTDSAPFVAEFQENDACAFAIFCSDGVCLKIFSLREPIRRHSKDCYLLSGVMREIPSSWQANSFLCNDVPIRTQHPSFVALGGLSLDSCTHLTQRFFVLQLCSVSISWIIHRDTCNLEITNVCFHEFLNSPFVSNHPWPKAQRPFPVQPAYFNLEFQIDFEAKMGQDIKTWNEEKLEGI